MHPLALAFCVIVPGTICAVAHFIPWRHWFETGRLPRLYAYSVGVAAINGSVILAALLGTSTVADVLWLIVLATASAFAGTAIPWRHDEDKRQEQKRQREADRKELYGE